MICPVCKKDMVDVEYHRIELDYCTACHGVWLDADELGLLLGSVGISDHGLVLGDMMRYPEAGTAEHKRKCPICGLKMKKVTLGKEAWIVIDVCQRGDGLWFDGGEIGRLLEHLSSSKVPVKADSQQQVISFLGDVFKAQEQHDTTDK